MFVIFINDLDNRFAGEMRKLGDAGKLFRGPKR